MSNSTGNAFNRVVEREHATDTMLAMPLDGVARQRRLDVMSRMTGGNGFPVPAKELRTDSQGRTRGERKRALRAAAMDKARTQIDASRIAFAERVAA